MLWMHSMTFPLYYSVETIVFISFVFDNSNGTIGFMERVLSLDFVPITFLFLFVDIVMFGIVDSIFVFIVGVGLKIC